MSSRRSRSRRPSSWRVTRRVSWVRFSASWRLRRAQRLAARESRRLTALQLATDSSLLREKELQLRVEILQEQVAELAASRAWRTQGVLEPVTTLEPGSLLLATGQPPVLVPRSSPESGSSTPQS